MLSNAKIVRAVDVNVADPIELVIPAVACSHRQPDDKASVEAAKQMINKAIAAKLALDVVPLMRLAGYYTNTMNTTTRMELRRHIVAKGGSLDNSFVPTMIEDETVKWVPVQPVNSESLTYDSPANNKRCCQMPQGNWNSFRPSANHVCGFPVINIREGDDHLQAIKHLIGSYCAGHAPAVVMSKSIKRRATKPTDAQRRSLAIKYQGNEGKRDPLFDSH